MLLNSNLRIISEQCNCPETLEVVVEPSLLDENNGADSLAELIESLIIEACGICKHYENGGKTKINRTMAKDTDITFPVIRYLDGAGSTSESRFVTVIEVPGLAIIKRKPEKKLGFYEKVMGTSVVNSWPIFAIFGTMTLAAGMLIWILVRKINISFDHQGEELSCQRGGIRVVSLRGVPRRLSILLSQRVFRTATVFKPSGVYFRIAFGKKSNSLSDSTVSKICLSLSSYR